MTQLRQVYKCDVCGNIVEVVHSADGGQSWRKEHFPDVDPGNGPLAVSAVSPSMVWGAVKWQGELPARAPYYASPTVADGKVYCLSEGGDAAVVAAGGGEFKMISECKFDEGPMQSTIAISGGRVFVRTAKKLYCFGK